MSRILIAPDSFKGSAAAEAVARALAEGWREVRGGDALRLAPMADGGEGTMAAFRTAYPQARSVPVTVTGPDDRPVVTSWLRLPDGTGLVELAATSGLPLMNRPQPLDAHSQGFGQAIRHALDHGVPRLLLALGGSASTDGGSGVLNALGARLLDDRGRPIPSGGAGLSRLAAADLSALAPAPHLGALILSDVTNPLLGASGAARIFAPQKGAGPAQVELLEAAVAHFASVLLTALAVDRRVDPSTRGSGAAGGVGYALQVWGAHMAGGAEAVGGALQLPAHVRDADLVITGEGRFDDQSAAGKVPSYVSGLAQSAAVPVALVAGALAAPTDAFVQAVSLTALAGSATAALTAPEWWLREAGRALAAWFGGSPQR